MAVNWSVMADASANGTVVALNSSWEMTPLAQLPNPTFRHDDLSGLGDDHVALESTCPAFPTVVRWN
jgi:hypothetical protein